WSKPLDMLRSDPMRRWQRVVLSSLLCLAAPGFAIAQTATTTPPEKPAQAAAAPARKSTHPTSGQATSKHSSTRTSTHATAQKSKSSHTRKGARGVAKKRGQQAIDSARAREIQ